jgi:hypothetical protein
MVFPPSLVPPKEPEKPRSPRSGLLRAYLGRLLINGHRLKCGHVRFTPNTGREATPLKESAKCQ